MAQRDVKDIAAGGSLIAIGLGFMSAAYTYGLGEIGQMGAGYFPFAVGLIVVGLGLLILGPALFREGAVPMPEWRPLVFNAGSILAFGFTIGPLGLVPAVLITALLSAGADETARPASTLALAIGLAIGIHLVFVVALGLPIPAFRMPF